MSLVRLHPLFATKHGEGVTGEAKKSACSGVSYRGLFTAGWFGVREKHCSRLEIYDRLRASNQADYSLAEKVRLIS